ncbi:MAG: hypothetical protein V3V96_10640 [Acidiferrobacterales bacterium]
MPLPANVKTVIKAAAHLSGQKHVNTVRAGIGHANRVLRSVAIKVADEPGPAESMAVRKVLALP